MHLDYACNRDQSFMGSSGKLSHLNSPINQRLTLRSALDAFRGLGTLDSLFERAQSPLCSKLRRKAGLDQGRDRLFCCTRSFFDHFGFRLITLRHSVILGFNQYVLLNPDTGLVAHYTGSPSLESLQFIARHSRAGASRVSDVLCLTN